MQSVAGSLAGDGRPGEPLVSRLERGAAPSPAPTAIGGDGDALCVGLAALRAGDLDRAVPLLAAAAAEGDGFALLAYGTALLLRRRYAAAIAPLERAAALLPERGEPLAYLGMARLHTLDVVGAREALQRALTVAPESFAVRLKYAEFLCRLGYYREALDEAERCLALTAPDAESLAFAQRLAALARQKAPFAYTRPLARLPGVPLWRLGALFRRLRRGRWSHLPGRETSVPADHP